MGFLGLRREVEGVEGVSVVMSEPGYSCFTTACKMIKMKDALICFKVAQQDFT